MLVLSRSTGSITDIYHGGATFRITLGDCSPVSAKAWIRYDDEYYECYLEGRHLFSSMYVTFGRDKLRLVAPNGEVLIIEYNWPPRVRNKHQGPRLTFDGPKSFYIQRVA